METSLNTLLLFTIFYYPECVRHIIYYFLHPSKKNSPDNFS
ncbi:hypothetical protein UNSWDHB_1388 [Dehalobacter sp. UNSWDHB]|nr:hypothetical protein DHBDCA_p2064 [Dehalobacter sp. DCA]EQB21270.1 hypothetical protein UNSWDHB_1388 [Dehalobacter sp. UNSWDHB]